MAPLFTPDPKAFYAHTDEYGGVWQPLAVHLQNVASLARRFAEFSGLADPAALAGLLHDLGKYRAEFQSYLRGLRGSSKETQHAIFGAAWAWVEDLSIQAFTVQGHHSGLKDRDPMDQACCDKTLKPHEAQIGLAAIAKQEGLVFSVENGWPDFLGDNDSSPAGYLLSMEFATRMVFSALVDADRLDTANWPEPVAEEKQLDARLGLDACLRSRASRAGATAAGERLAALRNAIFDSCLRAAEKPQGFFSLTVPTGGGKTLASLVFAMGHAKRHALRRVIIVIPYLSIIEQNAADYRRILGENVVLECHSAVEPKQDASEAENDALELVTENWDAPVIVTTSVQFIESLFAASPARCRKLHRIARSVVIFDEVQTLPSHLLAPVLNVFRELQSRYGVSFVFSSATQPAFRKATKLPDGFMLGEVSEITDAPDGSSTVADTYRALRRVDYHLPAAGETISWTSLAERLENQPQVLCIVNLTRHAKELWEALSRRVPSDPPPIHLSSHMCAQHRLDVITAIKLELKAGRPVRVISTQLIEAGVDLDFPVVYRAMGPLDSIVQAAGRCNREGKVTRGQVHVFRPEDVSALPPGAYYAATQCAENSLANVKSLEKTPEDILAEDAGIFADYFSRLWDLIPTDHSTEGEGSIQKRRENLDFATVAERAKVIREDGQKGVIAIGCSDGTDFPSDAFVKALRDPYRKFAPGKRFTRDDLRQFQRYMVNVRPHDFAKLTAAGALTPLLPSLDIPVLGTAWYHRHLGLLVDGQPLTDFIF
jgi:CRISPR-associated endonuclease/helicase Cas3